MLAENTILDLLLLPLENMNVELHFGFLQDLEGVLLRDRLQRCFSQLARSGQRQHSPGSSCPVPEGPIRWREGPAMAMERYRREMETIERERINFLNKIDLVQPSFEEKHQLEVRRYGYCSTAEYEAAVEPKRLIHTLIARPPNLTTTHRASPYYSEFVVHSACLRSERKVNTAKQQHSVSPACLA